MSVRSLIGAGLRRAGYQVFKNEYVDKANLSTHLQKVLSTQGIDCIFDVGANRGQYYTFLREAVHYTGLVISFEPVPELHAILSRQAQSDSQWVVYGCALGQQRGTALFNVMKGDQLSSFRTPSTSSTDRFRDSNTVVATKEVEVRTLSDVYAEVLARHKFSRPYLKIDAQGFDLQVADGAGECLQNFIALQSEASLLPLYEGAPTFDECLAYFHSRGFVPSAFFPVANDQKLRLIDCDCVFVNPQRVNSLDVSRY